MTTRDIGASTLAKLYDQYSEMYPFRTERYRERARREFPEFSTLGIKGAVVKRFKHEDPGFYKAMRNQISAPRLEPRRSSPTVQIKSRTSILNPAGELTGGNFGARF
jgi:hypothetical protein